MSLPSIATRGSAGALLLASALTVTPAVAQTPGSPGTPGETSMPEDEDALPLVPPAPDGLQGHIHAAASIALAVPFGRFDEATSVDDASGVGLGLGGEFGYGMSRSVVLGLYGHYANYTSADECTACNPASFGGGAFVRYHLVQGLRFDPWMSAGLGYRRLSLSSPDGDLDYSGVEWLRLQVGGNWYALSQLAVGPYVEFNWALLSDRPDTSLDSGSHFNFLAGVRVMFDYPGR